MSANNEYDRACLHNIRRTMERALKRAQTERHSEYVDTFQHCLDELALANITGPVTEYIDVPHV
jgi:hypothetical protein